MIRKIPMLFYDCLRRTYQFSDWNEGKSWEHLKEQEFKIQDVYDDFLTYTETDSSDISSYVFPTEENNNNNNNNNPIAITTTVDEVESLSFDDDDDDDDDDDNLSSAGTEKIKTIPFVSLDIRWEECDNEDDRDYFGDEDDNNNNDKLENLADYNNNYWKRRRIQSFGNSSFTPGNNNDNQHRNRKLYVPRMVSTTEEERSGCSPSQIRPSRIAVPSHICFIPEDNNDVVVEKTTKEEIDSASKYYQHQQQVNEIWQSNVDIFDPTDPLIHGSLDQHDSLRTASDALFHYLENHATSNPVENRFIYKNSADPENTCNDARMLDPAAFEIMRSYPETGQVKYYHPESTVPCYPISYFCITNCLEGVKAAYDVFPEAIGHCDTVLGTPLHYACYYRCDIEIIEFLLQQFPEAVRIPNKEKQTPLHLASMHPFCKNQKNTRMETSSSPDEKVIHLLLQQYPNAAQISDKNGMTPLHAICQWRGNTNNAERLLQIMLDTSPMAVHAVTIDMQKPLHVAAASGAPTGVLELLLQNDASQARFTDDHFQLPLHQAVQVVASTLKSSSSSSSLVVAANPTFLQMLKDNIDLLIQYYPDATTCTDENDETPLEMALRLKLPLPVIDQLVTATAAAVAVSKR